MPPDHRGWLDDRQGVPPSHPSLGPDDPQRAVPVAEARTPITEGTGEDADLVAERQVLHRELALRPKG